MAKLLFALVSIAFLSVAEACAQTASDPLRPPNATAEVPSQVTPDEAARALAVLQDPGRRALLIETLQTIARAAPAAQRPRRLPRLPPFPLRCSPIVSGRKSSSAPPGGRGNSRKRC